MAKIALITGGSRGLGKSGALHLAKDGIDIILTYHSKQEEAMEVVREIEAMSRKASALQFDAGDTASLDSFVEKVLDTVNNWGSEKLDILINNAGIGATVPIMEVTEEMFDRFSNIHFKSVYFLTQKMLPHINDGGRILNVSTGTTRFGVPGYSVYASLKSAIETFTKYLAKEIGSRKITANVVAPGPIETDFNNATIRSNPQSKAFLSNATALGRVGEADDIGKVFSMLCSDNAGWINGQRIEASGGINL